MTAAWKLIIAILLLSVIVTDANRARRRRQTQTVLNSGQRPAINPQTDARQQPLPNNLQGQFPLQQQQQQQQQLQLQPQQQQQQFGQMGPGASKDLNLGQNQAGRQYYSGYSNQYPQGGSYYPYGGSQYGAGQYPQYGQGMGSYGSYYNQYPGSSSFYSNNYRPGGGGYGYNYGSNYNNYYPGSGTYGGGYFWNAGQKQTTNIFTVFLSSILALAISLMFV